MQGYECENRVLSCFQKRPILPAG